LTDLGISGLDKKETRYSDLCKIAHALALRENRPIAKGNLFVSSSLSVTYQQQCPLQSKQTRGSGHCAPLAAIFNGAAVYPAPIADEIATSTMLVRLPRKTQT
jgi:hypothetical protein